MADRIEKDLERALDKVEKVLSEDDKQQLEQLCDDFIQTKAVLSEAKKNYELLRNTIMTKVSEKADLEAYFINITTSETERFSVKEARITLSAEVFDTHISPFVKMSSRRTLNVTKK